MLVISALGRLGQEDNEIEADLGLHNETQGTANKLEQLFASTPKFLGMVGS